MRVLSNDACRRLLQYQWPGNVRELENIIERALILSRNPDRIEVEDLPIGFQAPSAGQAAPVKLDEADGNSLDFSGMQLQVSGDQEGKASSFHGQADRFVMKLVRDDQPPATFELNGLKVGGQLAATAHEAIYVGNVDLALAETKVTLGPKQQVLVVKGLEQNALQTLEGPDTVGGRVEYKVGDITWDGRAVGKAR